MVSEEILEKPHVDVYGLDQHSWQNVTWTGTFGTLKAILATLRSSVGLEHRKALPGDGDPKI